MEQTVSVVMPAYQAAASIAEALACMRAQNLCPYEIVVVDDGSTDATAQIVSQIAKTPGVPVRLIQQANRGAGAARDAGIAVSCGEFVLLADADDRADTGLLRALLDAIVTKDGDLAFARCRYIDAAGRVVAVQDRQIPRPSPVDLLDGFMVNTPLVRRSAIKVIGGHDHDLKGSIDLDLRVRLALRRKGAILAVDAVLSDYRRTTGQITSDWRRMEASWTRVRDKAVSAGLELSPQARRKMRGHHCIYWATLAYLAGDYGSARSLTAEALRLVPGHVLRDREARIRAAACLASLLPQTLHDTLRARFNTLRQTQS